MISRRTLIFTAMGLSVSLLVCVFAFAQQKRGAEPLKTEIDVGTPNLSHRPSEDIPEHIFYGQFFSLLVSLQNTAEYESRAGLSKEQAAILEQIGKDCDREITLQDAKASKVIAAFRTELKKRKSGSPIEMPPQLEQLQAERDQIILHYRDLLKAELGPETFTRLTDVARELIKIEVRSIQ
nr:hypothetical protein [uncultured bacterium]